MRISRAISEDPQKVFSAAAAKQIDVSGLKVEEEKHVRAGLPHYTLYTRYCSPVVSVSAYLSLLINVNKLIRIIEMRGLAQAQAVHWLRLLVLLPVPAPAPAPAPSHTHTQTANTGMDAIMR